jgi:SAM-dependent methyltransferase
VGERKYYQAYEDRYRDVHRQGVKYWADFPWEVLEDLAELDSFLAFAGANPGVHRVLEPGCGEGNLALALVHKGFDYLGIDLAPSALEKARARFAEAGFSAEGKFVLHDATDLAFLPEAGFDFAVDNKLLHMLVVDSDRRSYLSSLRRALKPEAYVVFNEMHREEAYEGPVESFDQYLDAFKPDLTTVEERTAYSGGKQVRVRIPRVPARPRGQAGYTREMSENGFDLVHFRILKSQMGCVFYAKVR